MTSTPWALKKMLNHLQEKYKNPIVMIHENGNITWNTANNRASTDQTVLHFYCNNHTAKMIESSADKQSYCNNHTTKMIESSTDQPFYCNSHTANNKSSTDQQFYCISSDIIYTHSLLHWPCFFRSRWAAWPFRRKHLRRRFQVAISAGLHRGHTSIHQVYAFFFYII